MENSRSHLWRKCSASEPRTPTAEGWFSGKALLAFRVVSTGTGQFGELQQLVGRLAVKDTLSHVEQRVLGL